MRRSMFVMALFLLAVGMSCIAAAHAASDEERVVQEVVLVRHGIRSPTATPDALAVYATQPWPAWHVEPGQLTAHGAALMRSWGTWYRRHLSAEGLKLAGCDDVRVIADSTPRNRDSAHALTLALVPDCMGAYDAFAPGLADPLFHGAGKDKKKASSEVAPAFSSSALATLRYVLLGCTNRACLEQAQAHGKKVPMLEPPAKALKQAGTLSENLMLEYAQGMPAAQVGWGRADAHAIARMITLHNDAFAANDKILPAARVRGSTMLAYVATTLNAAAHANASLPSLAPHNERAVILVGHDTDLASQSGLLHLGWHNAVQSDDYPPAGTLIYQLVEKQGHYAVRLLVAQPTLAALRAADVANGNGMHVTPLDLPSCGHRNACPLARFNDIVHQAVDPASVIPGSGREPVVK